MKPCMTAPIESLGVCWYLSMAMFVTAGLAHIGAVTGLFVIRVFSPLSIAFAVVLFAVIVQLSYEWNGSRIVIWRPRDLVEEFPFIEPFAPFRSIPIRWRRVLVLVFIYGVLVTPLVFIFGGAWASNHRKDAVSFSAGCAWMSLHVALCSRYVVPWVNTERRKLRQSRL